MTTNTTGWVFCMLGDAAHPLVALNEQTEHHKQQVKELRKAIDDTVFKQQSVENKMLFCTNWTVNAKRFLHLFRCIGDRLLWNSHLCDVTKGTDTFPKLLPSLPIRCSFCHLELPQKCIPHVHHCLSFDNLAIFVVSCKRKAKYFDFWRSIKSYKYSILGGCFTGIQDRISGAICSFRCLHEQNLAELKSVWQAVLFVIQVFLHHLYLPQWRCRPRFTCRTNNWLRGSPSERIQVHDLV